MTEPLKALVVDDEEDVAWLFRQRFRREVRKGRIELEFAHSGQEALTKLRTEEPEVVLVLSDINMPGMTGLDLLKAIKQERPELKVHMITAYSDDENRETAMAYGAEGYLTKPIDFDALKAQVFGLDA